MRASRDKPAAKTPAAKSGSAGAGLTARWRWTLLACLFALSCLPFLPALSQGYVEWDDDFMFTKNPMWRGLSQQNIDWMFDTMYMGHYQPLSWLSFAVEYELWGLNPQRMHLVNLLIHALNAMLLARLATRLIAWSGGSDAGREPVPAWIGGLVAALFFALHPLRVESVAWATERRDVLSTLFLLSTLLCWLRTKGKSAWSGWWWVLTLAFYVLSLLSKAWGMTLPALLLLLELYPLRSTGATLKETARSALGILLVVPFAAWCAFKAMSSQESIMAAVSWSEHGLMNRVAQASWGSLFYVWKTLVPTGLSPLYELEDNFDPWQPGYVIAMVFATFTTIVLFVARKRFPAGLAAWCAFLILASPVLGLFQSGAQKAADRYTYLACMPFAVLLGAGVAALIEKRALSGWRDRVLTPLAAALVMIFGVLGFTASAQTRIWKDSESLWRQVLAVEPLSYIAHHNLAVTIGQKGSVDEAIALEIRCIELRPGKGNVDARKYLGDLYLRNGHADLALSTWIDAFHVDPEQASVLAALKQQLWRPGAGKRLYDLFDEALAKNPKLLATRMEYATLLGLEGRASDSEAQYKAALAVDSRHAPALIALGRMFVMSGRILEAEPLLSLAMRVDSHNPDVFAELGALRAAQGQLDAAFLLWNQALMYAPNHPRAMALMRQYASRQ